MSTIYEQTMERVGQVTRALGRLLVADKPTAIALVTVATSLCDAAGVSREEIVKIVRSLKPFKQS